MFAASKIRVVMLDEIEKPYFTEDGICLGYPPDPNDDAATDTKERQQ
jgi:hypothetical protein